MICCRPLLHQRPNQLVHLRRKLGDADQALFLLLREEKRRQVNSINLIASENYASKAALQALGATPTGGGFPCLHSHDETDARKISRYERLCMERALKAFKLQESDWCVSVNAFSGAIANFSVFSALLHPFNGRICGLSPNHGGHGSHGDALHTSRSDSFTSAAYQTLPYLLDVKTGKIDYELLQRTVEQFRPQIVIGGFSCGTTHIDWARLHNVARRCGALLMADVAHLGGLIAGSAYPSPFNHADIVTMTTHKTLRGPRGSLIFYRRYLEAAATTLKSRFASGNWHPCFNGDLQVIDTHVRSMSSEVGHANSNHLAAITCALGEASTASFADYATQTVRNAQHLEVALRARGQRTFVHDDTTQTHIVLWDLRDTASGKSYLDTALLQFLLDSININANAYCVPNENALSWVTNGLRLGTAAMTSRGLRESDFDSIADLLVEARCVLQSLLQRKPDLNLAELNRLITSDSSLQRDLQSIERRVTNFAARFQIPGLDDV